MRRLLTAVKPFVPGQLSLSLSCLGSPVTETCQAGFHPRLQGGERTRVLAQLLEHWQARGATAGTLFAAKDVSEKQRAEIGDTLTSAGFTSVPSLAGGSLAIDFATIEEYLARLSYATRKDMRRKLKARWQTSVQFTSDIEPLLPEILELYRATRERSDWSFEELSASYFLEVINRNPGRALFALYRAGGRLVGANLLLEDEETLLDKFFVMHLEEGRRLNLYFVSWFTNIERCLARGLNRYVAGQAAYEPKLRLGCRLEPNRLYFRHRNRWVNGLLKAMAPLLAVEQPEPHAGRRGENEP